MPKRVDILAVASAGGHWEQLMLLSEAFAGMNVLFATTKKELLEQAELTSGTVITDCNRDRPMDVAKCLWECMKLVFSTRPKMIVSTGAAPGLLCLALGKLVGARTVWVESFANAEKLSLSGKMAGYFVNTQLTQWQHLARANRPLYEGELL